MSPERNTQRGSQMSASKPYTRNVVPTLLPSISNLSESYTVGSSTSSQAVERPGFPTYAQYKQIENSYIDSLTPRRQGKALISQSMFDRIWDVLHHPESQNETAQFRFWARKMFTINKNYRITLGVPEGTESAPQEVLLHDNLLVAIQEQLYDLLCYCHGSTGHGGRDKTCALIRKHYTWVPKDLVSNFIKACPTCIMKKCGNMDVNSSIPQLIAEADKMSARLISHEEDEAANQLQNYVIAENAYSKSVASAALQDTTNQFTSNHMAWSHIGRHQELPMPPMMSSESHQGSNDSITSGIASTHGTHGSPNENTPYNHFHPMVREVSLYKGLPNGWQYRHDSYETAHAEFMEYKQQQWGSPTLTEDADPTGAMLPRIPSIAGFWSPDHFRTGIKEEDEDAEMALAQHHHNQLQHHHHSHHHRQFVLPPMTRALDMSDSALPPALQNMAMGSPHLSDDFMPQIDPALLALSDSGGSLGAASASGSVGGVGAGVGMHRHDIKAEPAAHFGSGMELAFPASASFKRAAPPPLHLEMLANEKTFQALLAYRDGGANANANNPGGSQGGHAHAWQQHSADPSPTSSDDSCRSQLSPFSVLSTAGTTPESSAATTPVEETSGSAEMKGAPSSDGGKATTAPVGAAAAAADMERSMNASVQAVCGF